MDHSKRRTALIIASLLLLVAASTAGAAARTATWSGTVAAVSGDDLALVRVPLHFRLAGGVTEMLSGRSLSARALAPGTSVTLHVGAREADGRLPVTRVVVESKNPLILTGSVDRIADDRRHVEVHGAEIEIDDHTGFSGSGTSGRIRSARDLRVGTTVAASLVPTGAGTLRAIEIRAAASAGEPGEDQELVGTVTAVTDTAWTIETKVLVITDRTVFEGEPGLGDFVEVKFHADGAGALLADRVSTEDGAPGIEVEFLGIVEAIGDASWTISGQVLDVDASTQILDSPVVGDTVEVEAHRAGDGTLTATRIRKEDRGDGGEPGDDNGNDGQNHDAADDHGGQSGSGSGGQTGGGSPAPTSGGGHHGHGNDDGSDD